MACELGADAVGFVCFRGSPRFVEPGRLGELAHALPPLVTPVLLFVDAQPDEVRRAVDIIPNALLQFHGSETHETCRGFGRAYLRAVAMGAGADLLEYERVFPSAAALLADAPSAAHGGSGRSFSWQLLPAPAQRTLPLVLAGGLHAQNVGKAIGIVRPWAVDVSSGVELSPGIKSRERLQGFFAAVRDADAQPRDTAHSHAQDGAA